MKKLILAAFTFVLVFNHAFAQDDVGGAQADLVKNRAKNLRNNVQGGAPATAAAPTMAAPTPAPAAIPVTQGLSLAAQPALDHFDSDVAAIKTGTPATAEQTAALANDVNALLKGATKPSKATVSKLAADLASALAEKPLAAKDALQLAKNLNVIMNSAPISAAKTQPFVTQAQTILKTAGVSQTTVDSVGADLKSIINEIQQSKPKLYQ